MARHQWNHPGVVSGLRICKRCGCQIKTHISVIYGTSRVKKTTWFIKSNGNAILLAWDTPMPPCEPREE